MKLFNKYAILLASSLMLLPSCNDFLDKTPIAAVTPDTYLWSDADLGAYALKQYSFTTHQGAGIGIWAGDNHTDINLFPFIAKKRRASVFIFIPKREVYIHIFPNSPPCSPSPNMSNRTKIIT